MKKVTLFGFLTLLTLQLNGGELKVKPTAAVIPVDNNLFPVYLGAGIAATMTKKNPCGCPDDMKKRKDTRAGIILRGGMNFNNYLGLETRYIKTLGTKVYSKVTHYGLYLKPFYYITDHIDIYALLGYGKTKVTFNNGSYHFKIKSNGFSYGAGVEYKLNAKHQKANAKGLGFWFDVQRLMKGKGLPKADASVITAGISYDF